MLSNFTTIHPGCCLGLYIFLSSYMYGIVWSFRHLMFTKKQFTIPPQHHNTVTIKYIYIKSKASDKRMTFRSVNHILHLFCLRKVRACLSTRASYNYNQQAFQQVQQLNSCPF